MRIVDLTTFLAMPAGTIFMKYEPYMFGPMCRKDENCGEVDFFYFELGSEIDSDGTDDWVAKLDAAVSDGAGLVVETECVSRDGLSERDQLYAVLERQDLEKLVAVFTEALSL